MKRLFLRKTNRGVIPALPLGITPPKFVFMGLTYLWIKESEDCPGEAPGRPEL